MKISNSIESYFFFTLMMNRIYTNIEKSNSTNTGLGRCCRAVIYRPRAEHEHLLGRASAFKINPGPNVKPHMT